MKHALTISITRTGNRPSRRHEGRSDGKTLQHLNERRGLLEGTSGARPPAERHVRRPRRSCGSAGSDPGYFFAAANRRRHGSFSSSSRIASLHAGDLFFNGHSPTSTSSGGSVKIWADDARQGARLQLGTVIPESRPPTTRRRSSDAGLHGVDLEQDRDHTRTAAARRGRDQASRTSQFGMKPPPTLVRPHANAA